MLTKRPGDGVALMGEAESRMRGAVQLLWRALGTQAESEDFATLEEQSERLLRRVIHNLQQDLEVLAAGGNAGKQK